MRIGVYLGRHAPSVGGSFSLQNNLVRVLKDISTHHEIIFFGDDGDAESGKSKAIEFVSYPKRRDLLNRCAAFVKRKLLRQNAPPYSQLSAYCRKYAIDIVWFVTQAAEPVCVPYIYTVLDIEHRMHPLFPEVSFNWQKREELFSYMIPRASYVICGTHAGKKQVIDFYHANPDRVKVNPFPAPTITERNNLLFQDVLKSYAINKEYLFYPAQFWPHKNHVCLLKSLKILAENHSADMLMVFSGVDKGNMSYIKEIAAELEVAERVRFIGFVSDKDLAILYENAFALVFGSFFGPDNLPPLEAFASGCPVIASNVAGAMEQMGDCAILVDPRREIEFADAVMQLKSDPELRDEMIKKGKEKAIAWSAVDYVSEIIKLVDDFESYRRCWSSRQVHALK